MKKLITCLFLISGITCFAQDENVLEKHLDNQGNPKMIVYKGDGVAYDINNLVKFLEKELQLSEYDAYMPIGTLVSSDNSIHYSFQQHHKNIKVHAGGGQIHMKNGKIISINGTYKKIPPQFSVKTGISEQDAFGVLMKQVLKDTSVKDIESLEKEVKDKYLLNSDIVIWNQDELQLGYEFTLDLSKYFDPQVVYINANNGEIIETRILINHCSATGTADTYYSGDNLSITTEYANNTYSLKDLTRADSIKVLNLNNLTKYDYGSATEFFDANNGWTSAEYDNEDEDMASLDVMWGLEKTYDYFNGKYNYESYDGLGSPIYGYVHLETSLNNAFSSSIRGYQIRLFFGDGTGDPIVPLDVVAHEFGHGLYNLWPAGEPGAINEGMADIWGACVDGFVNMGKDVWLGGADLPSWMRRSMSNPNSTNCPDTYEGDYWSSSTHTNSTVLSHWFYLLSEGGSGENDNEDCYSVAGIGIDKAAEIVFKTSTVYINYQTDVYLEFEDLRLKTLQAAQNLYQVGSNEEIQVRNAWQAVGVGERYSFDGNDYQIDGSGLVCSSGASFFIDNLFEGATVSWSGTGNLTRVSPQGSNPCIFSANSGEIEEGTIGASICTQCESAVFLTPKNVNLSGPDPDDVHMHVWSDYEDPSTELCANTEYHFYIYETSGHYSCYCSNYSWSFPAGWDVYYTGGGLALINTNDSPGGLVEVAATTSCCSETAKIYSEVWPEDVGCDNGYYLMFTPNPSTSETIVSIGSVSKKGFDETAEWEVEIYDQGQILKEKKTRLKGREYLLNTSGWKEGVYIVRVNLKENVKSGVLIVTK